jgi:hypothetical protein
LPVAYSHRQLRRVAYAKTAAIAAKTADETFVVSGTLVRDDKSPIVGARVMIAEAKDGGYAIGIGKGGVLENPSMSTGAKGAFSIAVKRSLFKERQEFVVVVPLFDGSAPPMPLGDGDVAVQIDKIKKAYELGTIANGTPLVRCERPGT